MAELHRALLTLLLIASWATAAPSPAPAADSGGCCGFSCCKNDSGCVIVNIIELVLALLLGIVFAILSLVVSLLGPATDTTTLLGALNGVSNLEGFLGSLPIVPKLLNIINVPNALLG